MTHLCVDICQNFAVRFFSQTSIKLSFLTDFFLFFYFIFVFFFFFFFFFFFQFWGCRQNFYCHGWNGAEPDKSIHNSSNLEIYPLWLLLKFFNYSKFYDKGAWHHWIKKLTPVHNYSWNIHISWRRGFIRFRQ